MSSYQVVIPSYNRADDLIKDTLNTLSECGVPRSKITIFVANKDEYKIYRSKIKGYKIVVAVKGIQEVRQYIVDYFKENQYIISFDDDVKGMYELHGTKLKPITNLPAIFKEAYDAMKKTGAYIWAPNKSSNPRFMRNTISDRFNQMIGTVFGFINRHDKDLHLNPRLAMVDDFERTVKYWIKDGIVLRLNYICYKTVLATTNAGGLQASNPNRIKEMEKQVHMLYKAYPTLFKGVQKNKQGSFSLILKSGYPEV